MQMEALECGAASLAMVLAHFKKWIPLEQVRADCGVSRDGSNAMNVVKAARGYGLVSKANRYNAEQIREKATYPCIIHWNFNHFVVLCGFSKKYAFINDPARGTAEVPIGEFDKSFTGICLSFEPSDTFEPGGKPESIFKFARRRMTGAFVPFLFVMVTSILAAFSDILQPVMSRIFLDNVLAEGNARWLTPIILTMLALVAYGFTVNGINAVFLEKIRIKLSISANSSFMWHVLRLPMEFFSQRTAGDIAGRQNSNSNVAETLINELAPVLINLLLMVLYLTVMLRYSPLLTAAGLLAILINLLLAKYISYRRLNYTRVLMREMGKMAAVAVSGIDMIETIKASGAENGYFERFSGIQASVNAVNVENNMTVSLKLLYALPEFVQRIANIVILTLGVFLIMKGDFSIGMLLAFQGFIVSFLRPVEKLIGTGQEVQKMRATMERIDDVMKYPTDIEDSDEFEISDEAQKLSGNIEMKSVTFGYSRLAPPLVTDFNLSLPAGSKVAFVGSSGCGKSTLAKLISGLYDPWEGEILFDGIPRKEIPHSIFCGSLAVVDQDIILFEDTISENIKMWDGTIEDFEVILAAKDAQIHEDIMLRDGGYGALVQEGGKNFSGGQRQRFEIARVLSGDPSIVILDEATSALDAKTEYEVIKAIKERGVTCIIVAHRLSTIRDCDEIIVMDKGVVIERGTHTELFEKGGMYSKLISVE